MPTTITVLSWNIKCLGAGKATNGVPPQKSEIVSFISRVVQLANADIVGIMEVQSGIGSTILGWLLASLNEGAVGSTYQWEGSVSARQDGGTKEEYLLLWKQDPNRLTLDPNGIPGPTSLVGVVDGNALAQLFEGQQWDPAQQNQFYTALQANGYVTKGKFKRRERFVFTTTWRVVPAAWQALSTASPPTVVFQAAQPQPPTALTATQCQSLATQLVNIDILRFNTYGDRSPFLGNFLVGNAPKKLMVSLLHAPGPSDITRTDAINIMGLSIPMRNAVVNDSLLLMGDFNIDDRKALPTAREYGRIVEDGKFTFAQVPGAPLQLVFEPLTGAPLDAPDLLPGVVAGYPEKWLDIDPKTTA